MRVPVEGPCPCGNRVPAGGHAGTGWFLAASSGELAWAAAVDELLDGDGNDAHADLLDLSPRQAGQPKRQAPGVRVRAW